MDIKIHVLNTVFSFLLIEYVYPIVILTAHFLHTMKQEISLNLHPQRIICQFFHSFPFYHYTIHICKQNAEPKPAKNLQGRRMKLKLELKSQLFFVFASSDHQHHHHYHSTLIPQSGYLFYFSLQFLPALLFLFIFRNLELNAATTAACYKARQRKKPIFGYS